MTGLLSSEPFVAVFPSLVRLLGSMEAAALVQYVAYRQPRGRGPAAIPVREFVEALGVSDSTVKRHTAALVERGILTRTQDPGRVAEYAVNRGHPDLGGEVNLTPPTTYLEDQEQTPPPRASGEGPPILALVASGDTAEPALFASDEVEKRATPEDTWPAEATIAGCQQAWTAGYEETRPPAHPGIRVPAMKAIKDLAKTCETLAHWRALWEASRDAGRAGRYAVREHLGGPPVSRYRSGNVHVHNALGMMDELLAQRPAIGGPV